jgi:predicted peptidase
MKNTRKLIRNIILSFIVFILSNCASFVRTELPTGRQSDPSTGNYWIADYSAKSGLNYVITFPKEYAIDSNKKWPLIVFLHSMAERGNNINLIISNPEGEGNGIIPYVLKKENFQFITISPLCPDKAYWPSIDDRLDLLIEDINAKYLIQTEKVYLTGVSMGGMGVWSLAMSHPKWFSAVAPISGAIYFPPMIENLQAIKNLPVWAFHDLNDPDIPISKEQDTIRRLQQINPNVTYTISETGEHYIHEDIYEDNQLFNWFLGFSK